MSLKKAIKSFFSVQTKETKFGSTAIKYILALLVLGGLAYASYLIPIRWLALVLFLIFALSFFTIVWLLLVKMIVISENIRLENLKNKKYIPKHPSITLFESDFEIWLTKATVSERIHIKSRAGYYHTIAISVTGDERTYYFDDNKHKSLEDFRETLKSYQVVDSNRIEVFDTHGGKPELLLQTIKQLKEKND